MGKSLGNYVGVGEPAQEQFGKIMSIPDNLMWEWFTLLTERSPEEVARLTDPKTTHPRQAKEQLARDVVSFYHGADAPQAAAEEFCRRFPGNKQAKQDPTDITEVKLPAGSLTDGKMVVSKLLVALDLAKSNNDARRLIQQGGVNLGPERDKVTDPNQAVAVTSGLVVRVGKLRVVRVQMA